MPSKELSTNLGIIGLGNIGVVHADVLREPVNRTGLILVAVADPSPKRRYPGVRFYSSHEELLADEQITAVSILTPPNSHHRLALDSISSGKNVLVEKPPALTLEELEEMAQKAREKKIVLFTPFHTCYRPEVEAARKELEGKEVKRIEITYKEDPLHFHNMETAWVFKPEISGGGYLIDSGINAISAALHILPKDTRFEVQNADFFIPPDMKVETLARVNFTFDNGSTGVIDLEWMYKGLPEVRQIAIKTRTDSYLVDIVQGSFIKNGEIIFGDPDSSREIADPYVEYRGVYKDFAKHLREGTPCVSTKELKFVLDAYKFLRKIKI